MSALVDERAPKAVFCESVGNPLQGNVVDFAAFADVAHAAGVPLIVDNHHYPRRICAARSDTAPTSWCIR